MNLVHYERYSAKAAMSGTPHNTAWTADKAIDGNTNQGYQSNSCASSDVDNDKLNMSFWKVWLSPSAFNIAYLQIYFRSDSK